MEKIIQFCKMMGLHPLVGFGMFTIDQMLFVGEGATLGLSIPISIGVAIAFTIPSILIQKYGFKEEWPLAIGKGLLVGVLTGIPTGLPSIPILAGGAFGAIAMIESITTQDDNNEDIRSNNEDNNPESIDINIPTGA
jgi:hypothetical protein